MKTFFKAILTVAAAAVMVSCSVDTLMEKALNQVAEEANKTLPMMLDEITSLDSLGVAKPRVLVYNYSITLPQDSINIEILDETVRANAVPAVQNPQLKSLRQGEVVFRYKYFDANGVAFYEIDITPEMYKE